MEMCTRRGIRAMHIGVARQAAAAHCLGFWIRTAANVLPRVQSAGVVIRRVTLLAQYRYRRE